MEDKTVTITTSTSRTIKRPRRYNFIPAQFLLTEEDGVQHIAAQVNGDGTLFVDWEKVRRMAELCPLHDAGSAIAAHMLLAALEGCFADEPRDCWREEP